MLVQPSDQPTRLDGDFFVRYGNTTRKLSDDEAKRWLVEPRPPPLTDGRNRRADHRLRRLARRCRARSGGP